MNYKDIEDIIPDSFCPWCRNWVLKESFIAHARKCRRGGE